MLFSKPTIPKPLEHWFNDIAAVERLREILSDPIYQSACATLVQAATPTFATIVGNQSNNEKLCWLGGYTDFLRDLQKLTKAPITRQDAEEWAHIS